LEKICTGDKAVIEHFSNVKRLAHINLVLANSYIIRANGTFDHYTFQSQVLKNKTEIS